MSYVCTNCGHPASKLFHRYKGGIIKMAICDKCGHVVDKYTEYDPIIISLDVLLLKRQAFRHILLNTRVQSPWKFCLVMLICEALAKLMNKPTEQQSKTWKSENVIYSALEVDLYWNFISSACELLCFVSVVVTCVAVWKYLCVSVPSSELPGTYECACGLMLSRLGKILVLPAIFWGQGYSALYIRLVDLFTLVANIQALRVLFPQWNIGGICTSVLFGHIIATGAATGLVLLKAAVT